MLLSELLALDGLLVVGQLGFVVGISHFQEDMSVFSLSFHVHEQVQSQQSLEVGDLELELGTRVADTNPALEGLVDEAIEVVALVVEIYIKDLVEIEPK